ncbi:TPA: J domain-containing protein [Vibrio parahaemolyticus]|nr:J domain-containing protein [Vibrio parahaemolyticus]HCH1610275.1 J domain-containing protein [Vibrio parahaemolyticus]
MSFKTIALSFTLSSCLSISAFASQAPTSPAEQFELAQQLALSPKSDSPSDVRYWLEQSASQGYLPAQKQLAEDYSRGLTGAVNYSQATYWFTSVALNDPRDRGFLLADFVQHHQKDITTSDLVEAWYQLASNTNPQAEEAYNHYLEERFNQLRAKQVSEIVELDKEATKEELPVAPQSTVTSDNGTIMWLAIGGLVIALAGFGGWVTLRKQQRALAALSSQEANQTQQLDAKVKELEFTNKQLKRQLEKVFKEFKKTRSQSDNHKVAVACAMFGYTPQTIPDNQAVKLRYRQLSKLYHPDTRGSEEEMKRLNQAFKIISQNVTKS